ncbi:MAG TPA: pyridoxamine 5'-phosphate oxidase family protein, partial [Clostridiales bacterium]|nr:pyridoxamine 5'-phosphate oxidase family protein [Clostridiales bacterium]
MKKVVEFLNANPVQYLATVGRDGKAKCRPFMFAGELDGKLWFCTNNQKDVYKDMQQNPEIDPKGYYREYDFEGYRLYRNYTGPQDAHAEMIYQCSLT